MHGSFGVPFSVLFSLAEVLFEKGRCFVGLSLHWNLGCGCVFGRLYILKQLNFYIEVLQVLGLANYFRLK